MSWQLELSRGLLTTTLPLSKTKLSKYFLKAWTRIFHKRKKNYICRSSQRKPSCRQLRGKIRRFTFFRKNYQFNVDLDLWGSKKWKMCYTSAAFVRLFLKIRKKQKKIIWRRIFKIFVASSKIQKILQSEDIIRIVIPRSQKAGAPLL